MYATAIYISNFYPNPSWLSKKHHASTNFPAAWATQVANRRPNSSFVPTIRILQVRIPWARPSVMHKGIIALPTEMKIFALEAASRVEQNIIVRVFNAKDEKLAETEPLRNAGVKTTIDVVISPPEADQPRLNPLQLKRL